MCVLAAVAATLVGCGQRELRTGAQAREFIGDIARGGRIGEWKLAEAGTAEAVRAWTVKATIENLGATLKENGAEWSCKTAGRVKKAGKVIKGIRRALDEADRQRIVDSAVDEGADRDEVELLIYQALQLTDSELVETVNAVCDAAAQL
jgi:hypothetical protein